LLASYGKGSVARALQAGGLSVVGVGVGLQQHRREEVGDLESRRQSLEVPSDRPALD
jgi:hypothetical protein